jgi:hypothetical protein
MNVCILWRDADKSADLVNVLVYGDLSARVYDRNRVDPRCADAVFTPTLLDACKVLKRRDGTKILVPVDVAREIIPGTIFAEPV